MENRYVEFDVSLSLSYTEHKNRNWYRFIKSLPSCIRVYDKRVYLAGGFIRSIFDGTPVKDYDLFFTDEYARDSVKQELVANGAKNIFTCPEGKLFTYQVGSVKIQLICERYYATPKELIDSFDIRASMFCLSFGYGPKLHTYTGAIQDARRKHIHLNKVTYPFATFNRINKYIAKGYYLTREACQQYVEESHALSVTGDTTDLWRAYID